MSTQPSLLWLFLAVKVPASPALIAVIEALLRWPMAVRPVACDQWHLTVRFLGDSDSDLLPALCSAAQRVAAVASPMGGSLLRHEGRSR